MEHQTLRTWVTAKPCTIDTFSHQACPFLDLARCGERAYRVMMYKADPAEFPRRPSRDEMVWSMLMVSSNSLASSTNLSAFVKNSFRRSKWSRWSCYSGVLSLHPRSSSCLMFRLFPLRQTIDQSYLLISWYWSPLARWTKGVLLERNRYQSSH